MTPSPINSGSPFVSNVRINTPRRPEPEVVQNPDPGAVENRSSRRQSDSSPAVDGSNIRQPARSVTRPVDQPQDAEGDNADLRDSREQAKRTGYVYDFRGRAQTYFERGQAISLTA